MRFSTLRGDLVPALAAAKPFTHNKGTLPILGTVLMSTEDGKLRLDVTDLEKWLTIRVPATVEEEGAACVPFSVISDLMDSLGTGRVDFDYNIATQVMKVRSGNDEGNLEDVADSGNFPPSRNFMPTFAATFDAAELAKLILRTAIFAATEESRPVLTGVSLKMEADGYVAAAADGFRLSKQPGLLASWNPMGGNEDQPVSIIVPARTLLEVGKLLKGCTEQVSMLVDASAQMVRFTIDGKLGRIVLSSQLLVGTFPSYEQLIPAKSEWSGVMVVNEFKRAAKVSYTFARDAANILRFKFGIGDDGKTGLVISAAADGVGRSSDPVSVTDPKGMDGDEPPYIAFNGKYVLDVLGVCDDLVELSGTSPSSPGVFRMEEDDFTHVVMPMFVQWGYNSVRNPVEKEPAAESPQDEEVVYGPHTDEVEGHMEETGSDPESPVEEADTVEISAD